MNIINKIPLIETQDYYAQLKLFLQVITNFSIFLTPTIKSLNKDPLYSRYDINTDTLQPGILQCPKHTCIVIDERQIDEGKLDTIGCKNYNTLKNLIEFGILNYEYPYSNIEIDQDVQILIISNYVKSLFNSSQLLSLPYSFNNSFNLNSEIEKLEIFDNFFSEEEEELLMSWFNHLRYEEKFSKNFTINNEVVEKIQNDFKNRDNNFTADDLDLCMKLARLYAVSNGNTELSYEDYIFAKNLEKERKMRLDLLKK